MKNATVLALVLAAGLLVLGYFFARAAEARDQALRAEMNARRAAEESMSYAIDALESAPAPAVALEPESVPQRQELPFTTEDRIARMLADLDAVVERAFEEGPDQEASREALGEVWKRLYSLEERAEKAQRAAQAERAEAQRGHRSNARIWVEDAKQIADAARRNAAIEEIRAALFSADEAERMAALSALAQIADVEFDKASFRAPLLSLAAGAEGQALVSSLFALAATDRRPEDVALALRTVDDPEARSSAVRLAFLFSDGGLVGEVGAAVAPLLDPNDPAAFTNVKSIWGAEVSPEIATSLLEMSRHPDHSRRHDVVYYGLSTLREKSPEIVARLIELLDDGSESGRALWGLGQGVPGVSQPTVANAMQVYFDARSDRKSRERALAIVHRYGTPENLPWLEALRDNPNASQELRASAERAIEAILSR